MQPVQSSTKAPRVTLQCVLAEMAGAGDRWAQEELLRVYEPLINSTSFRLLNGAVSQTLEDIKQLASMSILSLAASFESGRGAVFTTYAFNYLARKVRRLLDESDALVRIPTVHKASDRKQFRETGTSKFNLFQTASIDSATSQEGDEIWGSDDLLAYLSPESVNADRVVERLDEAKAVSALNKLRPLDRQVVAMRLFKNMAFNEIGPIVGRTHQGALNVYLRGMSQLRRICGVPQVEDEDVGRSCKKRR